MSGKATLVVGADSDIGSALIKHLSGTVAAHYFAAKEKLDDLETSDRTVVPVYGDFSSLDGIFSFLDSVEAIGEEISQIAFFPSSPAKAARIARLDAELFLRELHIQAVSFGVLMRQFLPRMAKAGFGRVAVALTSYCIGLPPKYLSTYVSAKYALMGLVKAAAVEYAGKGITVNAVAPSMTETKFLSTLPDFEIEAAAKRSPMGRNAAPDDLIPAFLLLLSDENAYMTGSILPVTGGESAF